MILPFQLDLSGKTAVVTGGSGVLGACFARALAACGARVAILARNPDNAKAVLEGVEGEAAFFAADVTDLATLQRAKEEIINRFGKPSILINGAGGNNPRATTEDEFYHQGAPVRDFFQLDLGALKTDL